MRKTLQQFIVIFLTMVVLAPAVKAVEVVGGFYYVIPPAASISIHGEAAVNESPKQGKMIFQKDDPEVVDVPFESDGLRIFAKDYQADIRHQSKVELTTILRLQAGSVHVKSFTGTRADEGKISMGDIRMSFQSANFLLYVSGDQSEKILKVIEGEVTVENEKTRQNAIVGAQEATSTDPSGNLLIPVPFDPSTIKTWWDDVKYNASYPLLPIANAGEDQRSLKNIPVVLDGSVSEFHTGDIFEWILSGGPKDDQGKEIKQVAFDSTNIVKPLFTPTNDGEYHFTLQITNENGDRSNIDDVVVYIGKDYLKPLAIFSDVPLDHPNNLAITYLYKKNVMKGSLDAKSGKLLFRPEDTINRVEILKTIFENKRQKLPTSDELKNLGPDDLFLDVKAEHWFAPYVAVAKKMGIIKGNDGLYRPADKVLLVEALKMIVAANQINLDAFKGSEEVSYPDAELQAWYSPSLLFVKKYNLVDPDGSGNIQPGKPLTRAQFAEIIYRMESIDLLEKRAFLNGVLKDAVTKKPIPEGEIYVYTISKDAVSESEAGSVVQKGDLIFKSVTKNDGTFSISLPVHTKYLIEAISGNNVSTHRVVIELEEGKNDPIELQIEGGK